MSIVYDPAVFEVAKNVKEMVELLGKSSNVRASLQNEMAATVENAVLSAYRLGYMNGEHDAHN